MVCLSLSLSFFYAHFIRDINICILFLFNTFSVGPTPLVRPSLFLSHAAFLVFSMQHNYNNSQIIIIIFWI